MVGRFELEPIVGVSEAKAVWEKSFARELYFSSSRVALIQIAAPFGVDCLPIQPRNFSFSVLGPLARPFVCPIRKCYNQTELSAVNHPFSCAADFPCRRDVAQPGRALAWGARGRQFKSARPDQTNSK
jgi:hypothetical protein